MELEAKKSGIKLPLKATKDRPLMIRTISYFKNGVHPDPGNVQKGVCDALFYDAEKAARAKLKGKKGRSTGKGDDKYTGGSFPPPRYDKDNPRVIVIIEDYVPKEKKDGKEKEKASKERPKRKATEARAKAPKKSPKRAQRKKEI